MGMGPAENVNVGAGAPADKDRPTTDTRGDVDKRGDIERDLASVEGRRKWVRRLIMLLVLAAVIAGVVVYRIKNAPPPPSRYILATATKGDVIETIQSTGQVKPVTEVQVGAQVSGRVTKVFVDFNSVVKQGDILAEIDPTLFSAQIDSNAAQLAAGSASVRRAEANLIVSKTRLERAKKMNADKIGSLADVDAAQAAHDVAVADLAAAKAQVAQVSAQLRSSRTNLDYTRILSPIDGVVVSRAIDPGQTVAASFQAPTLFVLAQDLRQMRVFADIDEADVGRLKEGMAADISVDAFPAATFSGVVSQVRFSPVTTSGVVTYAAVIDVANPDLKLRPGMTATVSIRSAESKDVQRLPNAALRFRPTPPLDEKGKPLPQEPLPKLEQGKGRIYVVVDATPGQERIEPKIVDVGITDGINTEVKTDLAGLAIVKDETDAASAGPKKRGPF